MKVGFIGTGLMGRPMAERLLAAGYQVSAFNRTRAKAEPLRASGAEIAGSAEEAVSSADCVILMLTDAAAIRDVLLQKRSLASLKGCTVIQMGTISPKESIELQEEVGQRRGDYLEAPVLGSIPEASTGTLLVMVGSSEVQFERWSGVLECFGPEPFLVGKVGKASGFKLALNQLIASLTASFALSLGFVQRQGIEMELFMRILRQSALYAPTFDKKLKRMLDRDYANPNFPSKHLFKDVALFHAAAQAVNLETIGIEAIQRLLEITLEKGYADGDYAALFESVSPVRQQAGGS
ncbi:MAG: NAD(P)-dependent oxidoreductase [Syntrophobacterales bacterium]|jgi:3-hydroxyisobutyrate dehydrogenase